ncbi:MAG: secreted PhoX family phosphatase [Candidatus Azotimanducaceae bacterium]|jgi:secreted PhoX family phosphatase
MQIQRRTLLKGGLVAATQFLVGCGSVAKTVAPLVGFSPVPFAKGIGPMPTISDDYVYEVLIPWGTPLQPDGPAYHHPATEDQADQVGIGHDGMAYFPISDDGKRGMLALNHEYGRNTHLLGKPVPESLTDVRISQYAHGAGVVEIAEVEGKWQRVASESARRIHGNGETTFSGPAASSAALQNKAGNPYRGTFANCSNGQTPWNTYLTCEENFNLYFAASGEFTPNESQQRYGLNKTGAGYGWHLFDKRFDLSDPDFENEVNRFGWVMEIDPFDPKQVPVKRTALGRLKHEGAGHGVSADGRVVVYMGDDQRFEHIYKFVSADNWQAMQSRGVSPLDEGVLYVARFDEGGTGEWLPLTAGNPKLKDFKDQADILINTRLAATALGATDMDRPEWTTVAPNGDVYCTLTNNHQRKVANPANPQAPNPNGHIIRWRDSDDFLGTTFTWEIFLISDKYYAGENSFGSPDGLWADPDGRLFIMTDGDQRDGHSNQLLVNDINTGEIRRLLSGVAGCELTGITATPDRTTLFVNVQHPGNGDPKVTNFPAEFDQQTIPRDCTLAIRRRDGGVVGS